MAYKMKLDGFEIEVADANTASIIERTVSNAKKDAEDRATASAKEVADSKAALTALQAKHDAFEEKAKGGAKCDECGGSGKVDGEECENCEGEGKMDALAPFEKRVASRQRSDARAAQKAGAARAALLVQVAPHLSANEKLDKKSDVEIKRTVLGKFGVKLDGKDDVYVTARFDAEMEIRKAGKPKPIENVRKGVTDGAPPAGTEEEIVVVENLDEDDLIAQAKVNAKKHSDSMYFKNRPQP